MRYLLVLTLLVGVGCGKAPPSAGTPVNQPISQPGDFPLQKTIVDEQGVARTIKAVPWGPPVTPAPAIPVFPSAEPIKILPQDATPEKAPVPRMKRT
jgi:hypothetical protein